MRKIFNSKSQPKVCACANSCVKQPENLNPSAVITPCHTCAARDISANSLSEVHSNTLFEFNHLQCILWQLQKIFGAFANPHSWCSAGTPSPGWYPLTRLVPPHQAGTPSPGWYPLTRLVPPHQAGTPSPGWYPLTRLVPPHQAGTPSPGWYPLTRLVPPHQAGCTKTPCYVPAVQCSASTV